MITSLLGSAASSTSWRAIACCRRSSRAVDARTNTPVITTLTNRRAGRHPGRSVPIADLLALVKRRPRSRRFAIVCAGVFVLRLRKPDAVRPFRAPFGLVTAALGVLLCLLVMTGLGSLT